MISIKNITIFFQDGMYTADIDLGEWYIVTEGKTFDELLKMIDDAIKWYTHWTDYNIHWSMPFFTFNFSHNASHVQAH